MLMSIEGIKEEKGGVKESIFFYEYIDFFNLRIIAGA